MGITAPTNCFYEWFDWAQITSKMWVLFGEDMPYQKLFNFTRYVTMWHLSILHGWWHQIAYITNTKLFNLIQWFYASLESITIPPTTLLEGEQINSMQKFAKGGSWSWFFFCTPFFRSANRESQWPNLHHVWPTSKWLSSIWMVVQSVSVWGTTHCSTGWYRCYAGGHGSCNAREYQCTRDGI